MNERIIKLYEQAQAEVVDSDCADYYKRIQLKFAELIIRECAEVASCNGHVSGFTLGDLIKERFGVE